MPLHKESLNLKDIEKAHERMETSIKWTPLVPLNVEDPKRKIYLKLENIQPIGSFKIRGAFNAVTSLPPDAIKDGVWTVSTGNFAQALACISKQLSIPCHAIVPDHAPEAKVGSILARGASVTKVPSDEWFQVVVERKYENMGGTFIHPVAETSVIAGTGTVGLEIVCDLPEVDSIVVPYGGGSLSSGVAIAAKGYNPKIKVYACVVETGAQLSAALKAGHPVQCQYTASFAEGSGGSVVIPDMWPLVKEVVDDALVVTLKQIAEAVKLLVEVNHVIAEGAGAASVAAALDGQAGEGNIVCYIWWKYRPRETS